MWRFEGFSQLHAFLAQHISNFLGFKCADVESFSQGICPCYKLSIFFDRVLDLSIPATASFIFPEGPSEQLIGKER